MPGFVAHLMCDLESGVGAVTLMNGPGGPNTVNSFALECARAATSTAALSLPPLPPERDATSVAGGPAYAGSFVLGEGPADAPPQLRLVAEGEQLRWMPVIATLLGGRLTHLA